MKSKAPIDRTHTLSPTAHRLFRNTFLSFSTLEQALIAKRLSFLIHADIPLHESLTIIGAQTRSRRKRELMRGITSRVFAGMYLSSSLEEHRTLFHPLTITLIRIGEQTGTLGDNLAYLASELRKRHTLRQKILGALIYPLFVVIATVAVTGALVMFIFPKLMPIFQSLQIELPSTTKALLGLSAFLDAWWLHTIAAILLLVVLFLSSRSLFPFVRYATDTLLIHTPIIGPLVKLYNATQFTRTLELTQNAGVSLREGILLTCQVTENVRYARVYDSINNQVTHGGRMSTTLRKHHSLFPETLPYMIETGENSGSLAQTLGYLSELFESEIDDTTKNLSNSIEPILLTLMGLTVGLVAVSVITPIYEITRHMQSY